MLFRACQQLPSAGLILGTPILINLLTVGSVVFEPVRELISRFMSDPTFTGRDEIWRFALDNVAKRPLFGFGFEAFWGMPDLVNAWSYQESWGYRASDAHNGYLNLAVTTGLVGLALSLCWIILQPFADHRRAQSLNADGALRTLFLQIWMMGLCLSGFEFGAVPGWQCIVVLDGRFDRRNSPDDHRTESRVTPCCKAPIACLLSTITTIRAAAPTCSSSSTIE